MREEQHGSLAGSETLVRLTGAGAKQAAAALLAVTASCEQSKGKARLGSLLKSGKELFVLTLTKEQLKPFAREAKRYGVLYTVVKDKEKSGPLDLIVRREDAGKISRIIDRLGIGTVRHESLSCEIVRPGVPGKGWVSLDKAAVLKVMGLGALSCITAILHCFAMSRLPVAVALTLLSQFTWIGLVIQIIITRCLPRPTEIIACVIILSGAVLASNVCNVYKVGLSDFDPIGLVCGFMSAVSCALFVALSGRVQAPCSSAQRGFIVCLGSGLASLFVCPDFLISGVIFEGIAPYGFVVGLFGMLLPVLMFGIGTPNLSASVSTVLAASELPVGLIVSVVVLGDEIGAMQWVGVLAILFGVVVSQLRFGGIAARMDKDTPCSQ